MLMMQALEKADEAKNTADKSVNVIETSLRTIDDILGQIGEYLYAECFCESHLHCTERCQIVIAEKLRQNVESEHSEKSEIIS